MPPHPNDIQSGFCIACGLYAIGGIPKGPGLIFCHQCCHDLVNKGKEKFIQDRMEFEFRRRLIV